MTAFVPGLELARMLSDEVRPVLAERGLAHTTALVGPGSDVLGLDDATSTDHDWGPRLQVLLSPTDHAAHAPALHEELRHRVPSQIGGWTTRVAPAASDGTRGLGDAAATGPVDHRVEILTLDALVRRLLGPVDPRTAADWLVVPQQRLLSLTAGAVFHDDLGLDAVRDRLRYYPHDVWLYQQAAAWSAIGQDEHLAPRAGMAGDDLGSRLVTARVCRTAAQLAFLQERRYAPYDKWLGTALARIASTAPLRAALATTLAAPTWSDRQHALGEALVELVRRHNALGLTAPVPETTTAFHGRPFEVIDGAAIAGRLVETVTDPEVRGLVARPLVGGIDLLSASTDLAVDTTRTEALRRLY
ncbi:DUF4037 domain-containing protein [Cellulomonas sp. Leaf334]|uniref:DUF4037 domain-containing protein n=1 Tax=Cellulomonas sp. Leaf334 TaxID=1736339 RepID=UPI0006F79089|nr:DUF4037 domain-containing protein [Cellulomonas sp. Leaf334]KQR07399.1 hypothetical protein ASF78_21105 [Cellulomonas sp. Leaf334]